LTRSAEDYATCSSSTTRTPSSAVKSTGRQWKRRRGRRLKRPSQLPSQLQRQAPSQLPNQLLFKRTRIRRSWGPRHPRQKQALQQQFVRTTADLSAAKIGVNTLSTNTAQSHHGLDTRRDPQSGARASTAGSVPRSATLVAKPLYIRLWGRQVTILGPRQRQRHCTRT
jgi:hypothetical protein